MWYVVGFDISVEVEVRSILKQVFIRRTFIKEDTKHHIDDLK